MSRSISAGSLLAALLGLVLLAAPAASQQDTEEERLVIRSVDTTNFPDVRIAAQPFGATIDPSALRLVENDEEIEDLEVVQVAETDTRVGIVLVLDTSADAGRDGSFSEVQEAASALVASRAEHERIALVAVGDAARTIVGFTSDTARLTAAIDRLEPGGGRATWDGVTLAAELLQEERQLQPNLVVLATGEDTASTASDSQARAATVAAKAPAIVIGLVAEGFDGTALRSLADGTGGTYLVADRPTDLTSRFEATAASLQSQYEVRYRSSSTSLILDLEVTAGPLADVASSKVGTLAVGTATDPTIVPTDDGALSGAMGKWLGGLAAFVAVALLAYGVAQLMVKEESTLTTVLRPYDDSVPDLEAAGDGSYAETRFVQRAVALTEGIANRQGFLPRVASALERADLPFRPGEALFFHIAIVTVLGVLALVLAPSALLGFVAIIVLAIIPPAVVSFLAGRRRRAFLSQLPDTLQLLSGTLRAGYSLMQGVDAVSEEVEDPMGKELRRVLVESRLGRPLEQSLDDAAERMDSPDFSWAVMAIRIQREVGGNLAELLQTVAETMVARERLRREVKALTAEGRISAIVLGLLPIGIGTAVWVLNRDYINLLFEERVGQYMLGGSVLLALLGFWWMKKTIEIEI